MNQTGLDVTELTESSISASEVKPMWSEAWWGEHCGQFITRCESWRCKVWCVMFYRARRVCLVFCSLLCLISPAVQHQPPPTGDGHTMSCHPHMRHGPWGEGSTRGISPVTRTQIVTNGWTISCRVLSWRGVESVTDNLWCGHCTDHSSVTQTRQVWSVNLLSGSWWQIVLEIILWPDLHLLLFFPASECEHLTLHRGCQVIWHSDLRRMPSLSSDTRPRLPRLIFDLRMLA